MYLHMYRETPTYMYTCMATEYIVTVWKFAMSTVTMRNFDSLKEKAVCSNEF